MNFRIKNTLLSLKFFFFESTFPRSRSSRRLASMVSPSISALVSTDRMWITSARVRSRVCRAFAQCS